MRILALLLRANLHGLFPVHHRRIVDFTKGRPCTSEGKDAIAGMPRSRWIQSLGKEDQLVEYFKPRQKPLWMSQTDFDALPDSIIVRELRRTVCRPGLGKVTVTIVTTLLDAQTYRADELIELRLRRWDVETNIGHLKTTMGLDVLHCKSEAGVRKELAVFLPGVQSGASGHAGGFTTARGSGEPDQLCRRAPNGCVTPGLARRCPN